MTNQDEQMKKIVSLCKRRGFIFPSSEIYGGFAAIYDYGPLGVELLNNVKKAWWKVMVQESQNIVGLDSAIFMHPKTWEASGHVSGFADPMAECKECNSRVRVDKLLGSIDIFADEKMSEEEINEIFSKHASKIKCPNCGKSNFSEAKSFNLLVKANLGNFTEDWTKEPAYLRGETCQGIYLNYKNVLDSMRVKVPFGIAQIGKAFRNEITARQFIFRTREFEQMEMQLFTSPDDEMKQYEKLKEARWDYYIDTLGFDKSNIQWHKHENLVFYAKEAYDIEYKFPWGFDEVEGIHARSDYDLTQHSKFSGQKLEYFDQENNKRFIPHIIESSAGAGRTTFACLAEFYKEEKVNDETRVVMKFPANLAPIKVAILPLSKKEELTKPARKIFDSLKKDYMTEYDETQSIGKRYRRQDEIGTPYCVTVDFDTLEDKAVTVRNRDSMEQERVEISELKDYLVKKLS